MKLYVVITTVFDVTTCIRKLAKKIESYAGCLLVVGDSKGPLSYDLEGSVFLTLKEQIDMPFEMAKLLPTGHYARKNIGYICAIKGGADCIYETDDDNAPLDSWSLRDEEVGTICRIYTDAIEEVQWVNVYRYFTSEQIWPRGLPLETIHDQKSYCQSAMPIRSPIQQGLVNNSPDVDAIWRLTQDRTFEFSIDLSLQIAPGLWCPFNTQSTWWWPKAYPLMYLPSYCSFRMCDIWKSFVAQRCLWEMGYGVIFHGPEVFQDRNKHNLMRDFEDEIPGYLNNTRIAKTLHNLKLKPGTGNALDNLVFCYEALIREKFFPKDEILLVKAWVHDLEKIL
jgi:hypothetical protein